MRNETLDQTLGNPAWMAANANRIKHALPETWTHVSNLNALQLGFQLKVLGIDWRSQDEFGKVMVYLERVGIMKRQGYQVRRAP